MTPFLHVLLARLRGFVGGRGLDRDFDEELQAHLAMQCAGRPEGFNQNVQPSASGPRRLDLDATGGILRLLPLLPRISGRGRRRTRRMQTGKHHAIMRSVGAAAGILFGMLAMSPPGHTVVAGREAGQPPAQAERAAAQGASGAGAPLPNSGEFPPLSTMAQLMRAVYFTNSNLIFTVQTRDPGALAPVVVPTSPDDAGFSFVDWGAGIYTGWQLVDNAALALADASALLMTPGRLCENGRPVPVDDPEWIRLTREMYDVAPEVYAAAETPSQEAVTESTGALSDACANCHRAYRDRRAGRGAPPAPGGHGFNAGRCISLASGR